MTHSDHASGCRGRRGALAIAPLLTVALGLAACGGSATKASSIDVRPYVGHGHVVDCDAFKSQADAQAVLRAEVTDPNGLDTDGDGIACPTLPAPKDLKPVARAFITDKDGAPVLRPLRKPHTQQPQG